MVIPLAYREIFSAYRAAEFSKDAESFLMFAIDNKYSTADTTRAQVESELPV